MAVAKVDPPSHSTCKKPASPIRRINASKSSSGAARSSCVPAGNRNGSSQTVAPVARQAAAGKRVAAICAAPLVLGGMGLLKGKRATCYPGCEQYMTGADYTRELFTTDGNITTGEGPAATFAYAYELLALLTDQATADQVAEGMMYKHLMATK